METEAMKKIDIEAIRKEFPTLDQKIGHAPLVYFDNGATSQKPQSVIDRVSKYYMYENANIHRGVHHLSQKATTAFEEVREKIQLYLNAEHQEEIIFTKGTTDSINLVANSFGKILKKGDEVLISAMEHHSNIVPWQMMAAERGFTLRHIPITQEGTLVDDWKSYINDNTKLISITHVSNALGTVNPIEDIINTAHQFGAKVLIDGAQSLQHFKVDVQKLDIDFFAFSGHKIFGTTGTGVLYGKKELLESMPPYQGGGDMIKEVTLEKTTYNELPHKFEAGTPNIAGVIGLGAAFDFLNALDMESVEAHETELLNYATAQLSSIEGIQFVGTAKEKVSVISFLVEGTHPYDVGTILDQQGVAVRTGHHCTQPIMDFFEIPGTIRASFALYNTKSEVDQFISALKKAVKMLR